MSDKNIVKYNAYIDKESGNMVCQQLNCNYSIQVYDMAQNMSAIFINTSPNPQSQIEFYANNSTNPASQTYSNCNLGINENNFYLYNMNGGTIWNTDLLANISTFYMPLNVNNTFTANSANISTLTAQQIICSPATQGAALHIYGDPYYSAELAFMTGSDKLFEVGTTTTNVSTLTGNFFFIYNNQNSTYSMQVITGSPQTINLNGNVNISNTLSAPTLTANTIVPTATGTGTIGTSSLSYYNSYFDTSNIGHAYIGFIDTLVYMQNGASFYGPINVLNPVTGDAVFNITVNNGNQLNFASTGQTAPLTIDAGSNTLNLPSDLIASGTVSANTINTTIITNPSGTTGTINVTGNVSLSTLFATTLNANIIDMNVTLATLTSPLGTGTIYWFQPFQGTAYKKVIAYFVGYENDTTTATILTFTTAFTTLGSITSNTTNGLSTASGGGLSLSNTELSIDPNNTTVYTGIIVIEGF